MNISLRLINTYKYILFIEFINLKKSLTITLLPSIN